MGIRDPNADERLTFSRLPGTPEVETLHARACARQWSVHHETFTLCPIFRVDGAGPGWVYRGRREVITPGVTMLMEPGEIHRNTEVTPPAEFRVVFIAAEFMQRLAEELGLHPRRLHGRLQQTADPDIHRSLLRFHRLLLAPATRLELDTVFTDGIGRLVERCGESAGAALRARPESARIRRTREFLLERLENNFSLEELASHAGLSRFYFLRAFAREVGAPPHEY